MAKQKKPGPVSKRSERLVPVGRGSSSGGVKRKSVKPDFFLEDWYSRQDAKQSFPAICRAVCKENRSIGIGGTPDVPLFFLRGLGEATTQDLAKLLPIGINVAKEKWGSFVDALVHYGVRFRVMGTSNAPRALAELNPKANPGAFEYRNAWAQLGYATAAPESLERIEGILKGMQLPDLAKRLLDTEVAVLKSAEQVNTMFERFKQLWKDRDPH